VTYCTGTPKAHPIVIQKLTKM